MRIKVERKIASSETMSVRKVKGKGSTCGRPGIKFIRIQPPNQTTCTHTNVMLPQKLAIFSARRSVDDRCSLASFSSLVTVSTFCSVNCSADGPAGRLPLGVSAALTDDGSFFITPAHAPNDDGGRSLLRIDRQGPGRNCRESRRVPVEIQACLFERSRQQQSQCRPTQEVRRRLRWQRSSCSACKLRSK